MKGGIMASFTVYSAEKSPGIFILFCEGSLDSNSHFILEEKVDHLLQKQPSVIVFDMQKLEYISSMGIRVLIKTTKAMKKIDGQVRYVNLKPEIKKVFDIVNVMPDQTIFTSVEELDSYLIAIQDQVKRGEIE